MRSLLKAFTLHIHRAAPHHPVSSVYVRASDAVIMPISFICQHNATEVKSDLSKTPNGRALLSYLSQHSSDNDIPSAAPETLSAASQHPFSIESLFGSRSLLGASGSGLGLFAQLLNPQFAENGGIMHIGTNDSSDGSGRAVVMLMRGAAGQPVTASQAN